MPRICTGFSGRRAPGQTRVLRCCFGGSGNAPALLASAVAFGICVSCPGFKFRVSCLGLRISEFKFPMSTFGFRGSGFDFWVSGFGVSVPGGWGRRMPPEGFPRRAHTATQNTKIKNRHPTPGTQDHPAVELRANLKSISHKCHLFEMAFVWELAEETIHLPPGCLQGGTSKP